MDRQLIATLAVLLTLAHLGCAIRCYQCNSRYVTDCGFQEGKLDDKYLVSCSLNSTFCRKIDQEVPFVENGMGPDLRVIRECGFDQGNEKPYYFTSGYGGVTYVYGCKERDGCNAASTLLTSPLLPALALITCSLLLRFN